MAKYKDPEERLEDIEKMVKSIKHTVDSMQRRSMIMTILRLLKLALITAAILYIYNGLQPFINSIGTTSVQVQNNVEEAQSTFEEIKDFFGIGESDIEVTE